MQPKLYKSYRKEAEKNFSTVLKTHNCATPDFESLLFYCKKAIDSLLKIPDAYHKADDLEHLSTYYFYQAAIFEHLGRTEEKLSALLSAKDALLRWKALVGKFDRDGIRYEMDCYKLIAEAYQELKLLDPAMEYFTKVINYFEQDPRLVNQKRDDKISAHAKYLYARSLIAMTELTLTFDPEIYQKAIDLLGKPSEQCSIDFLAEITKSLAELTQPTKASHNPNMLFNVERRQSKQQTGEDFIEQASSGMTLRSAKRIN